jgi:hydrogenase maturation protease
MPPSVLVIGIGNELRGDDGAGLEVARRLVEQAGVAVKEHHGEAIDLLDVWAGKDAVVLVDTVRSGAALGTIHRVDASAEPVPTTLRRASSHTIGVAETIELARTMGTLPRTVVVYGLEGAAFGHGARLSDGVSGAIDLLAEAVHREARALLAALPPG